MKRICILLFFSFTLSADLSPYLRPNFGNAAKNSSIKNIDAIYVINLDQRKEKLAKMVQQLNPYGIQPYRFSAINGWDLSLKEIQEVGVKFQKNMIHGKWVLTYSNKDSPQEEFELTRGSLEGQTCFSIGVIPGAIGCLLSHLSVLQNAYDQGYETIWVLEDDASIQDNPHKLTEYIHRLDNLLGKDGWDILFTDMDTIDRVFYDEDADFLADLKGAPYFWRPDLPLLDQRTFTKRTVLDDDFVQIGCRMRAHSMIYRRSGLKKILDFENRHHLFQAYDNDLPLIPGIRMINLRHDIITTKVETSDTKLNYFGEETRWQKYKNTALSYLPNIQGSTNDELALKLMDFIHRKKPQLCVEIGAYRGAMTFPIAKALAYENKGVVYAIDASEPTAASKDLKENIEIQFWEKTDFSSLRKSFEKLLQEQGLQNYCKPLVELSQNAASSFEEETIDMLCIDGNNSSEGSLNDVTLYLPKVKKGGMIWLKNGDSPSEHAAVLQLMKTCKWIPEESLDHECAVFQKLSNGEKQ